MNGKAKSRSLLTRLVRDSEGSHTTEMSLALALFALVAGFGFFIFGDALADFFVTTGANFDTDTLALPDFGSNPLNN